MCIHYKILGSARQGWHEGGQYIYIYIYTYKYFAVPYNFDSLISIVVNLKFKP